MRLFEVNTYKELQNEILHLSEYMKKQVVNSSHQTPQGHKDNQL